MKSFMNTQENNRLIAEFMGAIIKKSLFTTNKDAFDTTNMVGLYASLPKHVAIGAFKYHSSWDWLMPVVEKIESLGIVSFEKNLQEEGDYQALFTKGDDILICYYADTSIEATYQAVVEFIKQYNN